MKIFIVVCVICLGMIFVGFVAVNAINNLGKPTVDKGEQNQATTTHQAANQQSKKETPPAPAKIADIANPLFSLLWSPQGMAFIVLAAIGLLMQNPNSRRRRKRADPNPIETWLKSLFHPQEKKWDADIKEPAVSTEQFRPRPIITRSEQAFFHRLRTVASKDVVLAQVSLQALVDIDDQGLRNTIDRKYADFVICNLDMRILCVIELDDSTHQLDFTKKRDAVKDQALTQAGIQVIRIDSRKGVPNTFEIHRRIRHLITP